MFFSALYCNTEGALWDKNYFFIITLQTTFFLPALIVIFIFPDLIAVIFPVEDTLAIFLLEDLYLTLPVYVIGSIVWVSWYVCFLFSVMFFGTFLIAVAATAFFCTVTVIVFLSRLASVIVILALPVLLAALILHVPVLLPVIVISFLLLLVQDSM